MAPLFAVLSRDDGSTLRLREYDRDYFVAELRGLNLAAQARVGTYMSAGLAKMFAEMAASWRGWRGKKSWSSLEGELHVSAEADRTGHIALTVELREGIPSVWNVTLLLIVEAGQLEELARRAHEFEASVLSAA
jgi:hypothetical protein